MGILNMPTAPGYHPLKSCPRHEAPQHDNTEKRYICTDYWSTPACTSPGIIIQRMRANHCAALAVSEMRALSTHRNEIRTANAIGHGIRLPIASHLPCGARTVQSATERCRLQ